MDRIVGEGINVEARTNTMREPSDKKVKLCRLKLPNIRYFSYQEGQGMFESVGAWAYVTAISVIRFSDLFTVHYFSFDFEIRVSLREFPDGAGH